MNLKNQIHTWLFDYLDAHQPVEMQRRIKAHVDQIVPAVSRQTVMAYLDQQGFLHCAVCPMRHGLHVVTANGMTIRLCDQHFEQRNSLQKSTAANK